MKNKFSDDAFSATIDKFGDREFITSSYGDHEELCEALSAEANFRLKQFLKNLKSDLLCYSTGASVLSEDKIKEYFEE